MKTKTHLFARTAMMLILATLTTNLWAQDLQNLELLDGYTLTAYAEKSYEISSKADWDALAEYVAAGHKCEGFYFQMTTDIGTVEDPITKPMGRQTGSAHSDRQRFAGIFDGNNHTLTVNINSEDGSIQYGDGTDINRKKYCAPFAFTQNVTIKNLHVTGNVTTTSQFASGLVGQSGPDNQAALGVCVIDNCHVSVTFVGNTIGKNTYGNHGTFIAIAEGNATITDSWFDGKLTGLNYYYSGGFIGLNKKTATLTNCLFNPSVIDITNNNIGGSSEFSHDITGTSTRTNCYYTKSFSEPEDAQGVKVFENYVSGSIVDPIVAADGETYYIIKHNILWTNIIDTIASSATTLTLTNDVLAGTEDEAIEVPSDKTFELQLNGHTLDRGLDVVSAANDGSVFKVYGELTIAGGTLRGGNNTGNGGAIYNEGTLVISNIILTDNFANMGGAIYVNGGEVTVNNCTISDNKATTNMGTSGSGIFMNAGVLTLNGGTITKNKSNTNVNSYGLGVYVNNGTLNIQGALNIKDNKCSKTNTQQNVYLANNEIINITGSLSGANVRVNMPTPGVFTNDLSGYGNANNFNSDVNGYVVRFIDNEAKLVQQITRSITGYGETDGQWAFISSPVMTDVNPKDVNGLRTYNYDLYKFDQSNDPLEWINYKNHQSDFVLENGKGYLYANSNKVILKFAGDMYEENSKTINLDYDENARLAGYNLIGNPLIEAAYIDRPYYKMNADGTDIEAEETSTENSIAVCTGVIVLADGEDETVTFSTTAPESGSKGSVRMILAKAGMRGNNEMQDKAIVSFNEGTHLTKYIFNEDHAKLYIPQDGKDYAIASAERKGEMPVNFKATVDGKYTISINPEAVDMSYLHLIDNLTGANIDLLTEPCYSFNANADDYAARFRLVFRAKDDNVDMNDNDSFAFVSGDDFVLVNESNATLEVIDMLGHVVSTEQIEGSIAHNVPAIAGVYLLRLVQGENVRVQKIVVK